MRTALLAVVITLPAIAGPIAPPTGPVAETYKTLTDVEPRTAIRNLGPFMPIVIDQAGSYYLAENIDALPLQHGIEITSPDVSLDLNGFTIHGDMDAGSLDGIHVAPGSDNVEIKNGVVRNFVGYGILASDTKNGIISSVRMSFNNTGMLIWQGWIVRDCVAYQNAADGISTSHGVSVLDCVAHLNGADGISVGVGCTVSRCVATQNGGFGINTANRSTVSDCATERNLGGGIDATQRCIVRSCTAVSNTGDGIHCANLGLVVDCVASDNTEDGIDCTNGMIRSCISRGNTASNINAAGGTLHIDVY